MRNALVLAIILIISFITCLGLIAFLPTPIVNYKVLTHNIAYGKTYILYPGLFAPPILASVIVLGLMLLTKERVLLYTTLLLVYSWPIIISLFLLLQGYVISNDQPRLESALGFLIVSGEMTFSQASKISSYFNWPSTWLLEGVFSNIVRLSPPEASVHLMMITYILLGLALLITSRRIFPAHGLAATSLLAYALLNPYKILHFCPQIYALTLFVLLLALLLKNRLFVKDLISTLIISIGIITSHPLTSIIVAGIACLILLLGLAKERKLSSVTLFGAIILILFILWNINYENLVRSVVTELFYKEPSIQQLTPISKAKIYEVDTFYKMMILYRYSSVISLFICSLSAVIILLKHKTPLRTRLLVIGTGTLVGAFLLNFIPGLFLHRALYFASTLSSILLPITFSLIKEKLQIRQAIKLIGIIWKLLFLILPLLSHIALLEFLTNNNSVHIITSPYEMFSGIFIVKYYDFRGCVGNPQGEIGGLPFYTYMLNPNKTERICIYSLSTRVSSILVQSFNYSHLPRAFTESVYIGDIFMVSPRERFLYYTNTLINEFWLIDLSLNVKHNLVYNNEVVRVYDMNE